MAATIKSKSVKNETPVIEAINEKCGPHAVTVWRFLNNQEVSKVYGKAGELLHDAASISEATGLDDSTVFGCVIALVRNGWAKLTHDGSKVRAA